MSIDDEIQERCLEIAKEILHELQTSGLTPVESGRMLRGYKAEKHLNGAAVTTNVEYWKYVEFGTTENEPQPHVRPAVEAVMLKRKIAR